MTASELKDGQQRCCPQSEKIKKQVFFCGAIKLSIESSSVEGQGMRGEDTGSKFLALISYYAPTRSPSMNQFSSSRSHQASLPSTPATKAATTAALPLSPASFYYTPSLAPGRPPAVSVMPWTSWGGLDHSGSRPRPAYTGTGEKFQSRAGGTSSLVIQELR